MGHQAQKTRGENVYCPGHSTTQQFSENDGCVSTPDTATVALFWPATGSRKILFSNVFIHIPASKFKVADHII